MLRSKSRARVGAKTCMRRSSRSPIPPTSAAPLTDSALASDAMSAVDLFETHLDRLQGVHSVLWAMTALLGHNPGEAMLPQTTRFQLQQLAKAGQSLAGESIDAFECDRQAMRANSVQCPPLTRTNRNWKNRQRFLLLEGDVDAALSKSSSRTPFSSGA